MSRLSQRILGCLIGIVSVASVLAGQTLPPTHVDEFKGRPRVIVISDIGNEPDDQMSFVRLLLYSNELEIEGLIATTSTWQKTAMHPETMRQLIDAYGEVRPNLLLNAKGWPEAADLASRVFAGQSAYGMAATGPGKVSDGAKAIIRAGERKRQPAAMDLHLGRRQHTGAGASWKCARARTPEELARFIAQAPRLFDLAIRTMPAHGFAASFQTCITSSRRRRPPAANIISPRGPASAVIDYYRNGAGADFTTTYQ